MLFAEVNSALSLYNEYAATEDEVDLLGYEDIKLRERWGGLQATADRLVSAFNDLTDSLQMERDDDLYEERSELRSAITDLDHAKGRVEQHGLDRCRHCNSMISVEILEDRIDAREQRIEEIHSTLGEVTEAIDELQDRQKVLKRELSAYRDATTTVEQERKATGGAG